MSMIDVRLDVLLGNWVVREKKCQYRWNLYMTGWKVVVEWIEVQENT